MRFGLCTGLEHQEAAVAAGYDYLEPSVTGTLRPELPEAEILPPLLAELAASSIRPEAYNVLLPGDLKVVGPNADAGRQEQYLNAAFRRASALGGEIVVFGSGGSRRVPEDWPLADAHFQIVAFLRRCGKAAERHSITVAIEPLNVSECNFINRVAEAVHLAEEVGSPAVAVLSDLYHVAHDGQSYDETREAAPLLRHVHVAGLDRRGPVAADHEFLRGYFVVLKQIGYAGRVSIEANWSDVAAQAAEAREVVQRAWDDA